MPYHKPPVTCPVCKEEAQFKFIQDYKNNQGNWSLYECSRCKVQFWEPFKSPGAMAYEQEVDYSAKADILTRENARLIVKDYWSVSRFLKVFRHNNQKGKKHLDLGCGTGEFLAVMENLGYDVEGVDFDSNALDLCRRKLGIENIHNEDVISFLENKREEYDLITAFEVIEHLDNPNRFLELIRKALKPGGYLALSVPNRKRYFGRINPKIDIWDFPHQHFTRWDIRSLTFFVSRHFFEIAELKKEIPISWFIGRLRFLIEFFLGRKKEESFGPVEKVRKNIGLREYKSVKHLFKIICLPAALLMFYVFRFEGGGLFLLAKKN